VKKFEGREVRKVTVAIRNTGDGLSKAMGVEPKELHIGETLYVVIECEVTGMTHERIKIDGEYSPDVERRARLLAGTATVVDADLVKGLIDDQRRKIELANGIEHLDFEGDDDGS
jgi:hypothetical protein